MHVCMNVSVHNIWMHACMHKCWHRHICFGAHVNGFCMHACMCIFERTSMHTENHVWSQSCCHIHACAKTMHAHAETCVFHAQIHLCIQCMHMCLHFCATVCMLDIWHDQAHPARPLWLALSYRLLLQVLVSSVHFIVQTFSLSIILLVVYMIISSNVLFLTSMLWMRSMLALLAKRSL